MAEIVVEYGEGGSLFLEITCSMFEVFFTFFKASLFMVKNLIAHLFLGHLVCRKVEGTDSPSLFPCYLLILSLFLLLRSTVLFFLIEIDSEE